MVRRRHWTALIHVAGLALLATATAAPAALAELPRTFQVQRVDSANPAPNARFGMSAVNVGDVDGDGADDVLAGTDKHGNSVGTGQVSVVSGRTGAVLRVYPVPDVDVPPAGVRESPSGFGGAVMKVPDFASCPGGALGSPCAAPSDTGDGVPEHLISASGVDLDPVTGAPDAALHNDLGLTYVFDGATGALLKKLAMPAGDRQQQVDVGGDPWFGRTLLAPSGQTACPGNGGVPFPSPVVGGPDQNACPYAANSAAARGDVVGDALPDVLVGATSYEETKASAHPDSDCANQPDPAQDCVSAGRVYVFSGRDILTGGAGATLDAPSVTIKNPVAQADDPNALSPFANGEEFGALLIPIGDAGSCPSGVAEPASMCPETGRDRNAFDGVPDFALSVPAVNLFGMPEVGMAIELAGGSFAEIKRTPYPEPRPEAAFGGAQNGMVYPAVGQIGGFNTPDFYMPDIQYGDSRAAQGRGFGVEATPSAQGSFRELFVRFNDPTAQTGEQFGLAAAGVGNVTDSEVKELMIGAIGPHNPGTNPQVVNDVHMFNPRTGEALITVPAPDQQGGESFGASVVPLGDVNGDGFLDFAAGAGLYDLVAPGPCAGACTNAGRLYLFRSDDSEPPAPSPGEPSAPGEPATPSQAVVLAGRSLELVPSEDGVRRGREVELRGTLEAFANEAGCVPNQQVDVQRRLRGQSRYATIASATTDGNGDFALEVTPARTAFYRAVVGQTASCLGTASEGRRVGVIQPVAISRRTVTITRSGFARVRVKCPAAQDSLCTGVLNLKTASRIRSSRARRSATPRIFKIGEEAFRIPAGRTAVVKIPVRSNFRRVLARRGTVRVRATATNEDRTGLRAASTRVFRLQAR